MKKLSEKTFTWLMRLYPPLLFQRIWVQKFHKGFRGVDVKISKSIFNLNSNRSIFGGTIFAATDPFFPLLFQQVLFRKGFQNTIVWVKSAEIYYIKPGRSTLYIKFRIQESDIQEAIEMLAKDGKFIKTLPIELKNDFGEICALAHHEIYIKNPAFQGFQSLEKRD